MKRASAHARFAARAMFTPSVLRAIIGLRDTGEARYVRTGNWLGGDHLDTEGDTNAFVHARDIHTEHPTMAHLLNPGGILFALPDEGSVCLEVRPGGSMGPGGPMLLAGANYDANRWPSWARTHQGLYTWRTLRLEARDEAVEIQSGDDDDIVLNAGTRKVARVDDTVDCGTLYVTMGTSGVASIAYSPAGGPVLPGTPIALSGKITSGADRVKA